MMSAVAPPVYLVRHGLSTWNRLRLTQGQTVHPPLTPDGVCQSRRAGEAIAEDLSASGRCVDRIVSSDLVRALQTALVLGCRLDAEVKAEPRLREQHLGYLEGRGYDETWAAADQHDWSDPALPVAGGESVRDVHQRMADVLGEQPATDVVVLVSHGDAIRVALAHLTGVPPQEAPWVEVANGAVARFDGEIAWLS
jgi:2,3-bisphosphoglycerate-dependent phosphoglycerate mutase